MIDNGMLAGAARHYDDRAAAADRQARLAETMTGQLLDAVKRGTNPPLVRGSERPTNAADVLCELYGPEQDLLYRACHLALAGKFEASTAELLTFVNTAAKRFGESAAESLLEDD